MSGCGCGGSNPCNNMLLKYFGFDCSTGAAGKYVVNVTKDNCGNCNAYFVPETAASAFDCDNVTTCINTNAGTQTSIKNLLISLINSDAAVQSAICGVNCGISAPANVTNLTTTDSNGGAYDCGNPILNWTTSAGATSYDIFEGATLLGNTVSTTFTVVGASVGSHTYTVIAKNAGGSASGVSTTVNVTTCLTAPGNVTGTINVYDSGTATNYTCGLGFDVDFTDVSGATYYQLFEGATQIGSNSATSNFVVTGQTAGSHTYTIKACNGAGCSTGTNFNVTLSTCVVPSGITIDVDYFSYPNNYYTINNPSGETILQTGMLVLGPIVTPTYYPRPEATFSDTVISYGTSTGFQFTGQSGLNPASGYTYMFRAFCTTNLGTTYSSSSSVGTA